MIRVNDGIFYLETAHTSYIFQITPHGHPEQIYYGASVDGAALAPLRQKRTVQAGSTIAYDPDDPCYSADVMRLEWSGVGCGDYRQTPVEVRLANGTYRTDFIYKSFETTRGCVTPETLPAAYDDGDDTETLVVFLRDEAAKLTLELHYTVFFESDVIARRVVLQNDGEGAVSIRRLMSMSLDLENQNDTLVTFDGAWIKEAHRHDRKLTYGQFINSSVTGASSNRHNPGFLLYEDDATESHGRVYGFNLIYSGNHLGLVELSPNDLVRVQLGINPHCFDWTLHAGERFETPEAILTFSDGGFNGMSAQFHDFINRHIVRGDWKGRERPVLLNNWEATFFRFSRSKLMRLARCGKRLGAELFVLDDGWFGARNNDTAGLGDYAVNTKKLPGGMRRFSDDIHKLGMKFGLWFEPEMVNPDSDLYRAHPEYAVQTPDRRALTGRNQLVLDLCNPLVRDYIVENVGAVLDEAAIDYVKWDYNRHLSDAYSPCIENQGEFYHRFVMGLYDVLRRVFYARKHILFESCSSGGNRFDLGMLCFSQQVWSSDDTDAVERLMIQGGLSYLYPLSTMGAHVSASPNQQTLRRTALSTRFNVASFGCLGYELDPNHFTRLEKREVKEQIAFYKAHRKTMQFGRFIRHHSPKDNKVYWQCVERDGTHAVAGAFQTLASAAEGNDVLPLSNLNERDVYRVKTKRQMVYINRFGALIRHVLPLDVNPNGLLLRWADRLYALKDGVETYEGTGKTLMRGVHLNNQFIGTGYSPDIRLWGDFGSSLYTIERIERNE